MLQRVEKPFTFYTTMRLQEATGRKARNLQELLDGIKATDGSAIFHHTYGSLLRYHFMVPAPVSDFDFWVEHSLHDKVMAEKLSSIDTVRYATIHEIRDAHIEALQQHMSMTKCTAKAALGDEFHFVKDNSIVLPTHFAAWDLQQFKDCLSQATNASLYFHLFEARLRLEKPTNDFSLWLNDNLNEDGLAKSIAEYDPYIQTLDQIKMKILSSLDERLGQLHQG